METTLPHGMLPTDHAFPRAATMYPNGSTYDHGHEGMDLRTWLAGQALAGFAAAGSSPATAGMGAVAYADAVIAALGEPPLAAPVPAAPEETCAICEGLIVDAPNRQACVVGRSNIAVCGACVAEIAAVPQPPERAALIHRLRSQANHDGQTFPSGGEPPTALMRALLLEAADALEVAVPAAPPEIQVGDVVVRGGRLEPPRFQQVTTDYESRKWQSDTEIRAVFRCIWRRSEDQ